MLVFLLNKLWSVEHAVKIEGKMGLASVAFLEYSDVATYKLKFNTNISLGWPKLISSFYIMHTD